MQRAKATDKAHIADILTRSFIDNRSINYTVKQDKKREQRIRKLMEYSFEVCNMFGDAFLTDDKKGCVLILMPDKKKTSLKSVMLDVKLILSVIGISNVKKAMNREDAIKKVHPDELLYYLWFIGVQPSEQGKGIGSSLLNEVIREGRNKQRTVCLETSTLKNIPWYEKHGFEIYRELDFGYKLFCMKLT
jgi:ribosomal protein S18 acetylase RimI-like enzyme